MSPYDPAKTDFYLDIRERVVFAGPERPSMTFHSPRCCWCCWYFHSWSLCSRKVPLCRWCCLTGSCHIWGPDKVGCSQRLSNFARTRHFFFPPSRQTRLRYTLGRISTPSVSSLWKEAGAEYVSQLVSYSAIWTERASQIDGPYLNTGGHREQRRAFQGLRLCCYSPQTPHCRSVDTVCQRWRELLVVVQRSWLFSTPDHISAPCRWCFGLQNFEGIPGSLEATDLHSKLPLFQNIGFWKA